MRHVVFALFDDAGQEEAALREMEGVGISCASVYSRPSRPGPSPGHSSAASLACSQGSAASTATSSACLRD